MRKRFFLVSGKQPAYGKAVNDFMRAVDMPGAYVRYSSLVTLEAECDETDERWDKQPEALQAAYHSQGFLDVVVIEIDKGNVTV